jgi:hypothetical protein
MHQEYMLIMEMDQKLQTMDLRRGYIQFNKSNYTNFSKFIGED